MNNIKVDAIILAAGVGSRMNAGFNKVFLELEGREIIWHTIKRFADCDIIDNIILVTGKGDIERCRNIVSDFNKPVKVIEGGATRQESSHKGVLASNNDYVLIHDGARPFVTDEDIRETAAMAAQYSAAAVGAPCVDTLKTFDDNGFISGTVDRDKVYRIYTPQGFNREMLIGFHEKSLSDGVSVTDDCALCEYCGKKVKLISGNLLNIKLTTKEDLVFGEAIIKIFI